MILATYVAEDGKDAVGVVEGDVIFDLVAGADRAGEDTAPFASMIALMESDEAGLDRARSLVQRYAGDDDLVTPLADVTLRAPVPVPAQIRDFMTFPGHILHASAGMRTLAARIQGTPALPSDAKPGSEVPAIYRQQPIYYKANRFSVVGTDHDVKWPSYSEVMDYELEFGVFIGRGGMNIPVNKAREHIFGYAIFNDFSARDTQMMEMQGRLGPTKGKDFQTGNAIGPWIVTRDEISDAYALSMTARVNGEVWSAGSSAGMLHNFEDIIAFVSRDEMLHPGEFMASGTMGGGCGLEQDRYLSDGDVVELEVEGIGVLRNRVVR
jgi:2-keto-4-pentenoate hydratase/2-oxohepta-3-ene-1,7-dioic acid hydratase in catechol pathway